MLVIGINGRIYGRIYRRINRLAAALTEVEYDVVEVEVVG